jgi:hypothetical protein
MTSENFQQVKGNVSVANSMLVTAKLMHDQVILIVSCKIVAKYLSKACFLKWIYVKSVSKNIYPKANGVTY